MLSTYLAYYRINQTTILTQLGKLERAQALFDTVLRDFEGHYSSVHPAMLKAGINYAQTLRLLDHFLFLQGGDLPAPPDAARAGPSA